MSIAENISHPLVSALGWTVLHSLWQLLVIALLWRLSLELSRKHPAQVRYHLGLLALLAIPVTFVVTFIRQWGIYSSAKRVVSMQFEDAVWYARGGGADFYMVNKSYPASLERFEGYMPVVFWIYVAGLLLFSLHGIFSYYRIYTLRTYQVGPLPLQWKRRIPSLAKTAGVSGRISVRISKRVSIPVVIGFLKPVILLPLAMMSSLSPDQVEAVLLHEFRHIRNKDHYINFFQNLLEILFFYHPVTWMISRQLRDERENRVDEWVVKKTGTPLIYAQALLSLENKRSSILQPVLAATQSKTLLLSRIKNIMTMKTRSFKPGRNLAALAIILAATLSLAWFDPTKSMNTYAFQDYADRINYSGETTLPESQPSAPAPAESSASLRSTASTDAPATLRSTSSGSASTQAIGETDKKPRKIILSDGSSMEWESLSEKDRQQIQDAMREARLAIEQMNREMIDKFNSEEFRREMQKASEEVRLAMEEMNREFNSEEFRMEMHKANEEVRRAMGEMNREFNSEEFRMEMQKASEEVRRAMEEMNREFNSEEFRMEMQKASEEVRRAMEEMNREFNSEEFRREMEKAGKEVRKAMKEMENVDWAGFGEIMKITMEEVGKGLEKIGPEIQEVLMEVMKSLEESSQEKDSPLRPDKEKP
jgi:bla regulator protein blaR1